jgi:hypothetical protein
LLLVGGIIGAGLLGQLAFLAISTGVILLVIFMALYWKATRKTKVWESANPEPKWPLPTLIFKAEPSVLSSPPGSWIDLVYPGAVSKSSIGFMSAKSG